MSVMGHDDEALERDLRELAAGDPVKAVAALDALHAQRRFPLLVLTGPMFGIAEQTPAGWQVINLGEATPQCSRDDLAAHLRLLARDEAEPQEFLDAAKILDWERHDELTVAGRRFRVIRVEQIIRMNAEEPEPPRPTDPDPRVPWPRRQETLCAPPAYTDAQAELALQFAEAVHRPGFLSGEARAQAQQAIVDHPVLIAMAPAFSVAEYLHDGWRSATAACETPQRARQSLAEYLQHVIPAVEQPSEDTRTAYVHAALRLTTARLNELKVLGRRFRIVRLEKIARLGPEGPEMPRPSDFDPDPPVEILALQLRAEGLLED